MQVQKDSVRKSILDASTKLFAERGYAETSMRDIAELSEVGLGNIYNYFKNKEHIYSVVIEPVTSALFQLALGHVVPNRNEDLNEVFPSYKEDYITSLETDFIQLLRTYPDQLHILFFMNRGTNKEHFLKEMADTCAALVLEKLNNIVNDHPEAKRNYTLFVVQLHCRMFVFFLRNMLQQKMSEDDIRKNIRLYVNFEYSGWKSLLLPAE